MIKQMVMGTKGCKCTIILITDIYYQELFALFHQLKIWNMGLQDLFTEVCVCVCVFVCLPVCMCVIVCDGVAHSFPFPPIPLHLQPLTDPLTQLKSWLPHHELKCCLHLTGIINYCKTMRLWPLFKVFPQ